jgi:hypothetical protein
MYALCIYKFTYVISRQMEVIKLVQVLIVMPDWRALHIYMQVVFSRPGNRRLAIRLDG